jgi:oligo-1,6-glucosidase
MTNVAFTTIDDFRDIEARNHYAEAVAAGADPQAVIAAMGPMHRDNARTPMQWDDSANAGFTTGTPWIEVNPNYPQVNAAAALADPGSVFHHYRRLIELRHTDPVVVDGAFTMLLADDPHVYAFTRTLGDDALLVLANFTGETQETQRIDGLAGLAEWEDAEIVIGNVDDGPAPRLDELRPWEAVVRRRTGPGGVG